jgi:hypothetical protein
MGPTSLLPLRRKVCWGFFRPKKIRRLRPGLNPPPWNLGTKGQHATSRPPKPLVHGDTLQSVHSVCTVQPVSSWLSLLTLGMHSSGVSQHTVPTLAESNLLRVLVPTSRGPKPPTLNLSCLATPFVVLFQQFFTMGNGRCGFADSLAMSTNCTGTELPLIYCEVSQTVVWQWRCQLCVSSQFSDWKGTIFTLPM